MFGAMKVWLIIYPLFITLECNENKHSSLESVGNFEINHHRLTTRALLKWVWLNFLFTW